MSIRCTFYTIYHGKEYRVVNRDGFARLISHDINDLEDGFVESEPYNGLRCFIKMVPPSEIGDVYKISTYTLYQGYEFWIKWAGDGNYILKGNNNTVLMEKLDFKRVDKYDYEKIVKQEDVDLVYEKKTLLTDFFD